MNKPKTSAVLLAACILLAGAACSSEGEAGEPVEPAAGVLEMETFLTNINDPNRHARVQVKLAVAPESEIADIEGNALLMARLRDRVITLLTAKTYKDLVDPKGKQMFREEIRTELKPLIETAELKEVFFTDFVVE